jgi:hypothetical protein
MWLQTAANGEIKGALQSCYEIVELIKLYRCCYRAVSLQSACDDTLPRSRSLLAVVSEGTLPPVVQMGVNYDHSLNRHRYVKIVQVLATR